MGLSPEQQNFYLSEIGITNEGRGKNLGSGLLQVIQSRASNDMDSILRTSKMSPMFGMSTSLGYRTVFDYNDSDGRVILASKNI